MKEIIYLDTDLMNSMLAQLDKGLINNFSLEQTNQQSETAGQQTVRGKNAGIRGQLRLDTGWLPGGGVRLDGSLGNNGSEGTNESTTILEGQKDVLNKAFHDHALEVLTSRLLEEDMLKHGDDLKEGDLYLGESTYRFYDFNLLTNAIDPEIVNNLMLPDVSELGMDLEEAKKIVSKRNLNAQERLKIELAQTIIEVHKESQPLIKLFEKMNMLSKFSSRLLENLTVIKTSNKIGLLKKSCLRESAEALSFRTDKSRQVKFLVRVIGKKEIVYNGENFQFNENDLDVIPTMMMDIILGSFKIIEKDDLIVTPIAIYYE